MSILAIVGTVQLFVAVAAFFWLLRADTGKSGYERKRTLVTLAVCFVSLLVFVLVVRDILQPS